MPTGAAQLIVNLTEDQVRAYNPDNPSQCVSTPGTVLAGVQARYSLIDTAEQEHVLGVSFKPGGTVAFFGAPAHETRDRDTPLDFLLGRPMTSLLRERLLSAQDPDGKFAVMEQALLEAWRPIDVHPCVSFALADFKRDPLPRSVFAVVEATGLSAKRFIERFKTQVGYAPKQYLRILRFQRALTAANRGRAIHWAGLAADCGYFDQAHFNRDFRSFSGLTPTEYQATRGEFQNHVKFLQDSRTRD